MNEYLAAMTEIIEAHGGFVDKYIGDAIVAVFGAPLDDRDHAVHAVRAAIACNTRLRELNRSDGRIQGPGTPAAASASTPARRSWAISARSGGSITR